MTISGQTEDGFQVSAECEYFSHSGELEGRAWFTGADTALLENYGDGYETAPVTFQWEGEKLTITSGASGAELGFGANVTIDGTYTRDEPVYTNAGTLERCLTGEQRSALGDTLGEAAYGDLEVSFSDGIVGEPERCVLPDGTGAERYEVFYPTLNYYNLTLILAEDGRFYGENTGGFFTNDPGAAGMPER